VLKNSPMYKPPATVKVAMLPGTDLNTGLHHWAMVQITETVARDLAPLSKRRSDSLQLTGVGSGAPCPRP
jgi:hypothetical protein